MTIRAVVFDIGGVLEITPALSLAEKWEKRLHLRPGDLNRRMEALWCAGSLGECTLEDVMRGLHEKLGMNQAQMDEFSGDLWTEYLGQPNSELIEYLRSLHARFRTALLSNSFVGAREKEQARYRFEQLADLIIYSHEVGLAKPDQRIYELTFERLGVEPAEMIFLDDDEPSVSAARGLGIHAILFENNTRTIAVIEEIICAQARV